MKLFDHNTDYSGLVKSYFALSSLLFIFAQKTVDFLKFFCIVVIMLLMMTKNTTTTKTHYQLVERGVSAIAASQWTITGAYG